jgi:hypothetical protein
MEVSGTGRADLEAEAEARGVSMNPLPCGALTQTFQITVGLTIQSLLPSREPTPEK